MSKKQNPQRGGAHEVARGFSQNTCLPCAKDMMQWSLCKAFFDPIRTHENSFSCLNSSSVERNSGASSKGMPVKELKEAKSERVADKGPQRGF